MVFLAIHICAGTGSWFNYWFCAGVAAMGLEKIDFVWYLKKISILALLGYFAGAGTYILMQSLRIFAFLIETKYLNEKNLFTSSCSFRLFRIRYGSNY